MNALEHELNRGIRAHNRQCWLGAATALFFSWLTWLAVYAIFVGAVLLVETVRTGESAGFPRWLNPAFGVVALAILIGAAITRWRARYRPPSDRPIIGWHLIPEVLLLPAQLTYSIADHLAARITLSRWDRSEAARLLTILLQMGRAPLGLLTADFSDAPKLLRLLQALQFLGWIDLHQIDGEFFYRVCGSQETLLRQLLDEGPTEEK